MIGNRRTVHCPDLGLVGFSRKNGFYRFKGRHHAVVHVVVTMLSVTSDAVQIREIIKIILNLVKTVIGIEICRISFRNHNLVKIKHRHIALDNAEFCKFFHRKLLPLDIALVPVIVAFGTAVLKADPYVFFGFL